MGQAWSSRIRREVKERYPNAAEMMEKAFAYIPADQRNGPWSALPPLCVIAMFQVMAFTYSRAMDAYEPMPGVEQDLRPLRFLGFGFGMSVLVYMVRNIGTWPMVSWTMLGWTVATLRYLAGALDFQQTQRILTFPAVMTNTVTVLVWYLGIVPGMMLCLPKEKRLVALKGMLMSVFLALVHGFNLPFSLLDWYLQPVKLTLFDIWCGLAYGLAYITFYLLALDAVGLHLYLILTPRKWWSAPIYLGLLGMMVGIWSGMNTWHERLGV